MAKHTAGPWRCDHERIMDADGNAVALICDVYAAKIGTVVDWPRITVGYDDGHNNANARLIAATPTLLAALEAGVTAIGEAMVDEDLDNEDFRALIIQWLEDATAAINAAEEGGA